MKRLIPFILIMTACNAGPLDESVELAQETGAVATAVEPEAPASAVKLRCTGESLRFPDGTVMSPLQVEGVDLAAQPMGAAPSWCNGQVCDICNDGVCYWMFLLTKHLEGKRVWNSTQNQCYCAASTSNFYCGDCQRR